MTAAERKLIREEVSRRQHAKHVERRTTRHIPEAYMRILAACFAESTVDVEAHADRVYRTVLRVKAAG